MAMAGLECVFCLGCTRWAWKRCTYVGSYDSETWPTAIPSEFEPIPHVTRIVLAVYEPDLSNPRLLPPNVVDPAGVVKRASYDDTGGHSPPYLIYADRPNNQIVFAVRGLNIVNNADYKLLLNNKLGGEMFDGGYVHRGLLNAAKWLLETETGTLRRLVEEMGKDVRVVFAGHSLGSGIAALMTVLVVNDTAKIGDVPRKQIRGYAIAPARCMSLNLAVKYADVIHSVILQDDFLPRTATPLEDIFKSIFCFPCLLFFVCMRDTFIPEGRKLRDPRRLYAPGRMYHIVERKFCRCGRYPPEVRTAIPVEGRFEHIVLSTSVTKDHAIGWIVREVEKAWEIMKESGEVTTPPPEQRMERIQTIKKEHEDALERAVSLKIPHAVTLVDETSESMQVTAREDKEEKTSPREAKSNGKIIWDDVVEKLFRRSASGNLIFKHEIDSSEQ